MVRNVFLIFSRGAKVPTRRLFRVLQPYFMPERFAPAINDSTTFPGTRLKVTLISIFQTNLITP